MRRVRGREWRERDSCCTGRASQLAGLLRTFVAAVGLVTSAVYAEERQTFAQIQVELNCAKRSHAKSESERMRERETAAALAAHRSLPGCCGRLLLWWVLRLTGVTDVEGDCRLPSSSCVDGCSGCRSNVGGVVPTCLAAIYAGVVAAGVVAASVAVANDVADEDTVGCRRFAGRPASPTARISGRL